MQLAGCYYILGGYNPGDGVIIVRNATQVTDYVELNPDEEDGWYSKSLDDSIMF